VGQHRLLVTGAAGFTGCHLIDLAKERGYWCAGIVQPGAKDLAMADHTFAADLLDSKQVEASIQQLKPDYIVHLAAISFVSHDDTAALYQVNQLGTMHLLDAVRKHAPAVKKVLLASSANIYGNAVKLPITEMTRPAPVNHYGTSKVAMELIAQLYSDLPIVISRPFNYTGRGQAKHFLIPKIVDTFRRKEKTIELGNLDVARDFSDVRDVVRAYLNLLTRDTPEGIYNICSGAPTSLLSIVDMLSVLAGYQVDVIVNPACVRSDEIKTLYGSNASLESAIGDYREYSLEQTLAWMFESRAEAIVG
jgi:nucleoside-diphosphate-sugar epimerase